MPKYKTLGGNEQIEDNTNATQKEKFKMQKLLLPPGLLCSSSNTYMLVLSTPLSTSFWSIILAHVMLMLFDECLFLFLSFSFSFRLTTQIGANYPTSTRAYT